MPVLIIRDGPLAGTRVEVDRELTVGRVGADLTLDDSEVSRSHALLRLVGDAIEVEDVGSTNGTFVNGQRISAPTRLSGGDAIRFGSVSLDVEAEPEPEPDAGATTVSPVAVETTVAPTPPPMPVTEEIPADPKPVTEEQPSAPQPEAAPPPPPPPPPPPTPAPPPVAAPAAVGPPATPFASPAPRRSGIGGIATRTPAPTLIVLATITSTAVGLLLYFALR